jgi:hypothetical protein
MFGAGLYFLQTQGVGLLIKRPTQGIFTKRSTNAIHVPCNDLHRLACICFMVNLV